MSNITIVTPVGLLRLEEVEGKLCRIDFTDENKNGGDAYREAKELDRVEAPCLKEAALQLFQYFEGKRTTFELSPELVGTPFQKRVWVELMKIPYGETVSYGEIAERVGNPKGQRAVGMAVHHNPVAIVIPCHRVVKKGFLGIISEMTRIGGYAGGVEKKRQLLLLEKQQSGL